MKDSSVLVVRISGSIVRPIEFPGRDASRLDSVVRAGLHARVRRSLLGSLALLAFGACSPIDREPPAAPEHRDSHDGARHAARAEDPFSCGEPGRSGRERGVSCPSERPTDDKLLSCDTEGCHGGFDYTDKTRNNRHLYGSDGPSCYSCHGEKWRDD